MGKEKLANLLWVSFIGPRIERELPSLVRTAVGQMVNDIDRLQKTSSDLLDALIEYDENVTTKLDYLERLVKAAHPDLNVE